MKSLSKLNLLKVLIALIMSIFLFSSASALSVTNVTAQTIYKISNGQLVNSKTKKAVSGYKIYSKRLYYNGKLKKGYKIYSKRLYYNGKLKKGYKVYSKRLYYNGKLKKGYKVYSKRLYYNGKLKKGYKVYSKRLYYNGKLKKGYKVYSKSLYYNGSLKKGYKTYSGILYKNGLLFSGLKSDKLYKSGKTVSEYTLYKGKLYKKGGLINKGKVLYNKTLYDGFGISKGYVIFRENLYKDGKLFTGIYKETKYKNGLAITDTIPPFTPREDSTNKVQLTDNVKNVDDSSILSISDTTVQLQDKAAKKLEKGDIFFLPATDENPFGQVKKVTGKTNQGDTVLVKTVQPELDEVLKDMDISQQIPISGENFIINQELLEGTSDTNKVKLKKLEPISVIAYEEGFKIVLNNLKIKNLDTFITGTLDIKSPKVDIDIEKKKKFGIVYKYQLNRVAFEANEQLDLNLNAKLSGEKKERVKLGSVPVPYLGFLNAGVNIAVYMTLNLDGSISLDYGLTQSFSFKAGIRNDPDLDELEPFKELNHNFNLKDLTLQGEAKINAGIEAGVYFLVGDLSIMDLAVGVDANNKFEGKNVDLTKDNIDNPTLCYHDDLSVDAFGTFRMGIQFTKWLSLDYNLDLFNKSLSDDVEIGNCSYRSIEMTPHFIELTPGEQLKLKITGQALDLTNTFKDIEVPSEYVSIKSSKPDLITIGEDGTLKVKSDINHNEEVEIEAIYKDPVTNKERKAKTSAKIIVLPTKDPSEQDQEGPKDPVPPINTGINLVTTPPIVAGNEHTVYVKKDGTVWTWGRNNKGQLGDGSLLDRYKPQQVKGLSNIIAVAAGYYHSLALSKDGTIWAWGYNEHGQLGNGSNIDSLTPVKVEGIQNAVSIAAGALTSYAILPDGSVKSWGNGKRGLLGNGANENSNVPVDVSELKDVVSLDSSMNIWSERHTVALKSDGTVWTWGVNYFGALGTGPHLYNSGAWNKPQSKPVQVSGVNGEGYLHDIVRVQAGDTHTLALGKDGTIYGWGEDWGDELFDAVNHPVTKIDIDEKVLDDVVEISTSGYQENIIVRSDGSVWQWRDNKKLEKLPNLNNVSQVSSGGYHTYALTKNGELWVWGWNDYGQFGNGTNKWSSNPVKIEF